MIVHLPQHAPLASVIPLVPPTLDVTVHALRELTVPVVRGEPPQWSRCTPCSAFSLSDEA